jgi:hypothetical protein
MLRRVALVRTDVSEESSASFIRVTRIGELGTILAATSKRRTLHAGSVRRIFPKLHLIKITVFRGLGLYCPFESQPRFEGTYRFHLREEQAKQDSSVKANGKSKHAPESRLRLLKTVLC